MQKSHPKLVNLGDIAGNVEKEGEEVTGSCDSVGKSREQLPYFLLLEQTPYQPYHLGQVGSSSPISCFWSRHITNHNSLEKRGAAPLFPAFGADTLPTTTAWKSGEQLPYFLLLEQTHYQPQQLGKVGSSSPISCFWSRHLTSHITWEKWGAAPLFPAFGADTLPAISPGKSGEQLPYFLLLEQTPYQPYHLGKVGRSSPISCFWSRHLTSHITWEKWGAAPLFPAFGADTLQTIFTLQYNCQVKINPQQAWLSRFIFLVQPDQISMGWTHAFKSAHSHIIHNL